MADLREVDAVGKEHERDGRHVVHDHLGIVLALDRVVFVRQVQHKVDALEPEAQIDHVVPPLRFTRDIGEFLEVLLFVEEPSLVPSDVKTKEVEGANCRVLIQRLAHLVLLVLRQTALDKHVPDCRADEHRVDNVVVHVEAT